MMNWTTLLASLDTPLGKNLTPLTAHSGLIQRNHESNVPNETHESDADDSDDNVVTVGTSNTATLPVNRIEEIRRTHGEEEGDGGTSDVDGDGVLTSYNTLSYL